MELTMIKTFKQTIKNLYYWIKEKLVRLKKWIILIIFGAAVVAAPLLPPQISDIALEKIQSKYEASELKGKYRLEKTAFILDAVNENAIQAEVGNKNLDEFVPELTLRKWDDEVNFKVKYKHSTKKDKQKVDIENRKIKWKGEKTEVHYYEMKKGELLLGQELEHDVYEVEVLLLEKPDTNIVEFDIETKGLAFYYQPAVLKDYETYLDRVLDIVLEENPETVLDFGGGTGELAKQLIENGVKATVNDISQEAYDNRVVDDFILGDIFEELSKMDDNSYDLIIDVGVLKYIETERANELVSEIKRVSKKSIHFLGAGAWNPSDVDYLVAESDYTFWNNKFSVGEDEADVYKLSLNYRPENIVGSYAVYHESKAGDYSKMGLKNYRAGKAFHIYRPKIIDSAGTEVWGKLNITDNLLTVEIPQEFLDTCQYPVIVDPTFGYDSSGDTTHGGSGLTPSGGNVYASKFSAASGGTATSISVYTGKQSGSNSLNVRCGIYNSSRNLITNGRTNETAGVGADSWLALNFTTNPSFSSGDNWLAFFGNYGGPPYGDPLANVYYDTGDANQGVTDTGETYPTFPDPIDAGSSTNLYSIYCTYTAGGAEERRMFLTQ